MPSKMIPIGNGKVAKTSPYKAMVCQQFIMITNIRFTKISNDLCTDSYKIWFEGTRQGGAILKFFKKKILQYNNQCWWVRITIMNAIDVWILCPDCNYLLPFCTIKLVVSLFFSLSKKVETEGTHQRRSQSSNHSFYSYKEKSFFFNKNKYLPPYPCREKNNPTSRCPATSFQSKPLHLKWR